MPAWLPLAMKLLEVLGPALGQVILKEVSKDPAPLPSDGPPVPDRDDFPDDDVHAPHTVELGVRWFGPKDPSRGSVVGHADPLFWEILKGRRPVNQHFKANVDVTVRDAMGRELGPAEWRRERIAWRTVARARVNEGSWAEFAGQGRPPAEVPFIKTGTHLPINVGGSKYGQSQGGSFTYAWDQLPEPESKLELQVVVPYGKELYSNVIALRVR